MVVENLEFNISTTAKSVAANVNAVVSAFQRLQTTASTVNQSLNPMVTSLIVTDQELQKKPKDAKKASKAIDNLGNSAKKSTGKLGMFIDSLKRIAMYRILRTIIKEITQAFAEGLENAYAYSNAVGGDLAKSLDELASVSQKMKNQLGAALGELIQTLKPFLIWLMKVITWIADKLSQLFAALGGRKTYLKAADVTKKWAEDTKKGAKAAKDWKNQLLGFDEINRLEYDPSNGNGDNSEDPSDWYDEVPLDDWAMKISDFMDKIGKMWEQLKNWFDALKADCLDFAQELCPELVAALESVLAKVGALFPAPDLSLITAAVGAFDTLMDAIEARARGMVEYLAQLAPNINWQPMVSAMETAFAVMKGLVKEFGGFVSTVILTVELAFNEGIEAATSFFLSQVKASIQTAVQLVEGAFSKIKPQITQFAGFVQYAFEEMGSGIVARFNNIKERLKEAYDAMARAGKEWSMAVLYDVLSAIEKLKTEVIPAIKEWAAGVAETISNTATNLAHGIAEMVQNAVQGIGQLLSSAWNAIKEWANGIKQDVLGMFDSIKSGAASLWNSIKSGVSSAYNSVKNSVTSAFSPTVSTLPNGMVNYDFTGMSNPTNAMSSVSSMSSLSSLFSSLGNIIPAFAGGGFPEDGLFFANSGELVGQFANGQTAVANNADIVAGISAGVYEAVSAAMGNGSQNVNVYIDGKQITDSVTAYQRRYSRVMGV